MTPAGPRDVAARDHEHDWPLSASGWDEMVSCRTCGLLLLRGFVGIADWVVRRVEGIQFVDDRTVRRRVSVDYTVPADAVVLRVGDGRRVRILPVALMRRKNMTNFHFSDHDGRPMPLLGLRENQALTLAVVRAWADATLPREARAKWPKVPGDLGDLLGGIIAGDQAALDQAYREFMRRTANGPIPIDDRLTALMERLAGNFVLFASEEAEPGSRRILKWSYDEPLTLLYSTSSYQGHLDGPSPPRPLKGKPAAPVTYGKTGRRQAWWELDPLLAGLGLQPTLIRFPAPGAELAASFHLEITAPPEVSIVKASLLAGTPNLRFGDTPEQDVRGFHEWRESGSDAERATRARVRRRPSYDSVGGGYPTVDLHVAEVPYGSLSRAQVELQASPTGWLASAWLASLLASITLFAAWLADPSGPNAAELPAVVLISYAAAMVAVVIRPDPHLMVTRLLVRLRVLAAASAVLALAGGGAFAFLQPETAHDWLRLMAWASVVPTLVLTAVWLLARRRMVRVRPPGNRAAARRQRRAELDPLVPRRSEASLYGARRRVREARRSAPLIRLSPWEQHLPDHDFGAHVYTDFHVRLANVLDEARYPYDEAVVQLGFNKPGIKVASLEGDRATFRWTLAFDEAFRRLLDERIEHCRTRRTLPRTVLAHMPRRRNGLPR